MSTDNDDAADDKEKAEAKASTDVSKDDAPREAEAAKAEDPKGVPEAEPPALKAEATTSDATKSEANTEPSPTKPEPEPTGATPADSSTSEEKAEPKPPAAADDDEDMTPLSMRDVELEPVSLSELSEILAPGKVPPKLSDRPTPPKEKGEAADTEEAKGDAAPPRKRIPSVPKRAERAKSRPDDDAMTDSGLLDLRQLAATAHPQPGRRGSIPDQELANLSALTVPLAPLAPQDLAPPDLSEAAAPKPPKAPKKKPAATDGDGPATEARAASSRPASARPASSPKERDISRAPGLAANAPASTEAGSGRWVVFALAGAALFGSGFLIGKRSADEAPPADSATAPKTAAVAPPPTCVTASATVAALEPPVAASCPPCAMASEATASESGSATPSSSAHASLSGRIPSATVTASAPPQPSTPAPPSSEFDKSAASAALQSAIGAASGCKQPGDPSGVAHVSVTFSPSGRVTSSIISGPPFQGTPTGSCIARSFRSASVPPFTGDPVTVTKTVTIP